MTHGRELHLALPPASAREVGEVRAWLAAVAERARAFEVAGTCLVLVSPLGLADRGLLASSLAALDVRVRARAPLEGWARITTALRLPPQAQTPARLQRAPLFERAWRAAFPRDRGEAWAIDAADHPKLARLKRAMRAPLGAVRVHFGVVGEAPRLLSPFHLADPGEEAEEAARVLAAAELVRAAGCDRVAAARSHRERGTRPCAPVLLW